MALLTPRRRRARTAIDTEAIQREAEAAALAAFGTWLVPLLQNAERGIVPNLDELAPGLRRTTELALASISRVRRQAAEDVAAAVNPVRLELLRQMLHLNAAQQTVTSAEPMAHLFAADHANAMALRHAVRACVLATGTWPEPRRQAARLIEVGQAAQGRVADYRRIGFLGNPDVSVRPAAVEPLAAAVAELLDNALRHGGPQAEVVVESDADPGSGGAWVVVRDSGPGMQPATLAVVRNVLTGTDPTPSSAWPWRGIRLVAAAARLLALQPAVASVPGRTAVTLLLPAALLVPPPSSVPGAPLRHR
ncbi:ATP-binding protein [Kitasatospora purpeofusca]|uniref:ATP-binding protein n=1 Tax=Kitasatospora purpeofusca TaxID=67352 RepID=UPI0035D6C92B